MVEPARKGVIPPLKGRPHREATPRSVIVRRRLIALGVLLVALVVLFFAVAGLPGGGKKTPAPKLIGAVKPFRIVFPEGFTRKDMAKRITAVDKIAKKERGTTPRLSESVYLRLTSNTRLVPRGFKARRLEGFLFPATYDFTARTPTQRLVTMQLQAFRHYWAQLNLGYSRTKNLTPYDVLIIASMVEKETLAPEERSKVARVIYNRLHARMTLGIDATIRYGLDVPGTQSLTESDLASNSPYNTRTHAGLTPTPIANPGLASLQAAAHPANGCWLYFVRKPDKVHHFFTCNERDFINYKNAHGYK